MRVFILFFLFSCTENYAVIEPKFCYTCETTLTVQTSVNQASVVKDVEEVCNVTEAQMADVINISSMQNDSQAAGYVSRVTKCVKKNG